MALSSLKLRLPEGYDLVASNAPAARAQSENGETLVRFGLIEDARTFSLISGLWQTAMVKTPSVTMEVAGLGGSNPQRAMKVLQNGCDILYSPRFPFSEMLPEKISSSLLKELSRNTVRIHILSL